MCKSTKEEFQAKLSFPVTIRFRQTKARNSIEEVPLHSYTSVRFLQTTWNQGEDIHKVRTQGHYWLNEDQGRVLLRCVRWWGLRRRTSGLGLISVGKTLIEERSRRSLEEEERVRVCEMWGQRKVREEVWVLCVWPSNWMQMSVLVQEDFWQKAEILQIVPDYSLLEVSWDWEQGDCWSLLNKSKR